MGAANLDINIEQGATYSLLLTFKDSSNVEVNLTGYTFSGKIKETFSSDTVVSFTCTLGNQTTNTGEVTISLTAVETAAISVKSSKGSQRTLTQYFYDIEAVKPDASIDRVLEGKAFVSPEVTK
jgi:hypothetical protein